MFKKLFLQHKSKSKSKDQSISEHCTYSEAISIGVLYNSDEYDKETIEELTANLKEDGKEVSLLGFELKPDEMSSYFSKKDISNTGVFKNDRLSTFSNQAFDFLISLDSSENMNYRFVLALCQARCKIGIESQEYYELLHMALKKSSNSKDSVNSVLKYLKMI